MGSKRSKRKGVFAIVSALWWLAKVLTALVNAIKDLAKEKGLSDDVVNERVLVLGKPEGEVTIKQMAALIIGQVEKMVATAIPHLINTSADPFLPSGWQGVEEHRREMGQMEWDPTKVSLYLSFRQQGGRVIGGHDLRQELRGQPVLNACVLDFLLAHPELIPEEWKGRYIYFWGTIYRYSDVSLCVRFLCWDGLRWGWRYYWLGSDWDDDYPAAVASV